MKSIVPTHGTELIFVEDCLNFITTIAGYIDLPNIVYFTVPSHALMYINNTNDSNKEIIAYKKGFGALTQVSLTLPRVNPIAAVITDYLIPQMDGLEFLSKIHDRSITRALLTGACDDDPIEHALKTGLIHKHITKGTFNYTRELRQLIAECLAPWMCYTPISSEQPEQILRELKEYTEALFTKARTSRIIN